MQSLKRKAKLVSMRAAFPNWPACWIILSAWLACSTAFAQAPDVTNVSQVRQLASQTPQASYLIRLEGDVWWADPARGKLVLKDDSGVEELEIDLHGQSPAAGQKVRLEGNGTITPAGAGFRIGTIGPVVDNDGVHGTVEKSGAVFLREGRNPLRFEWFNGVEKYTLTVEYQGPGLARQKIPDTVLFRAQSNTTDNATNWVNGLDFKCAEALGELLPNFDSAPALKTGTTGNFDLGILPRQDHVGIRFTGFLQVPKDGLYTFYATSDDGSRLFVGMPSIQLNVLGQAVLPKAQPLVIGQTPGTTENGEWVEVEGKVSFASETVNGLKLELSAGTGRMLAEIANPSGLLPANLLNRRVRATGFCRRAYNLDGQGGLSSLLVPSGHQVLLLERQPVAVENPGTNSGALPLLVTGGEIHRLKREEAQREYPVKIRGVITSVLPEHQAFTIQDSTRGIYVIDFSESRSDPPRIGDFLEVEGVTEPGQFAPIINATHVRSLGIGDLPEPIHPTRDQLMNGSLDAQYVEIQGILTAVQTNGVILLTRDGRIKSQLRINGLQPQDIGRYEDALIRVRGCLMAFWDYVTHQVTMGQVKIYGADVTVDQPAPEDLFSIPKKTASGLFLFDPQAGVFQRVKVAGQIIHLRKPDSFMMDGNSGVRFIAKHPTELEVGDMVEIVGFPDLSSIPPVLREAVVRKTGHADLPRALPLSQDDLLRPGLDSTRVQVKAVLVNQRHTSTGQALEMQVGLRSFLAWLPGIDKNIQAIPVGSQLELSGTYASQDVASFELLLNSPLDVVVLARPPWWTLERLLVTLGALGCVLAGTVLWITQLRRKIDERTSELEIQIRKRQQVEQAHVMELERARIAQDLHDELGSGLTEITMLGARARAVSAPPEVRGGYLEQMGGTARQMVTALDEIVWAMNPRHDSLASMISYFSLYAERFLGLANIAWRLEGPFGPDDHAVESRHRHQLFLAFKEALTNVVRHSGATEVHLSFQLEEGKIRLTIADNGRGLNGGIPTEDMDGVVNMRQRMEKLGGRFEFNSESGKGTIIRFELPTH